MYHRPCSPNAAEGRSAKARSAGRIVRVEAGGRRKKGMWKSNEKACAKGGWVSPYIEESIRLLSIFETQLNQIFLGPWLSQILYVTYDGNMAKGKNAHLASAGRARGRGRANGRKGRAADAQNRRGLLVTTDDTSIWPESVVSGDVQPLHARTDDDGVGKDEDDKEQNTPGPSDPPSPLTSLATDVTITVPVAMWVSSRRRRLYLPHLMLFSAQDFDQCDPRRCSGKRLARQHIITELRIGSRFRGIVLSSVFFFTPVPSR